jgi:predicted  nucleic acid-binding Zn-ribbon protein
VSIEGAEAAQILDQLARVQVQLSNKVQLSAVTNDLTDVRNEIAEQAAEVGTLNTRVINAQASLNDIEQRVRDLETGV